jgi:phosphatidylglycerophosphate synthase
VKKLLLVEPEGPVEISKETVLLGLPLVERTRLAAKRAGFEEIEFSASDPRDGSVVLPWNAVVTVKELKSCLGAAPVAASLLTVSKKSEVPAAEKHLLRSLIKAEEGFMSRHVERKISLFLTRTLVKTPITPNAMTLVSVAVGLAGAACFLVWARPWHVAGALLFLAHSILDGCDGEIARLKFLESRWGGLLDFWGDNVVHSAVFACLGIGWSRAGAGTLPLVLAALAILGTLLSAGFVYDRTMRTPRPAAGPVFTSVSRREETAFSRAADALARRDFIYLVLLLAAFFKTHWFLVASAVGAPAYFLALVAIDRRGRERTLAT